MEDDEIVSIEGQTCKRGEVYARKELTNPTRVVTSTVKISGGQDIVVPVKTATDIPKNAIFTCLEQLKEIELQAPVSIGDVVINNVAETTVNVVVTKNVAKI